MSTSPGIFSVHAGTSIRFFDRVSEAQDFGEQHPTATIRKEYGEGWKDVARWDGFKWSYIHRKAPKAKKAKRR